MIDNSGSMAAHDKLEDGDGYTLVLQSEHFYVSYIHPFYFIHELKSENVVCICGGDGDILKIDSTTYTTEHKQDLDELLTKIPMLVDVKKYNL